MDMGAAQPERRARPPAFSQEEKERYLQRCWKLAQDQEKQQTTLDPSGSKRKTADAQQTLGRYVSIAEGRALLERVARDNARIRAELEAEEAACAVPSSPPQLATAAPPLPAPPSCRRSIKKSRW